MQRSQALAGVGYAVFLEPPEHVFHAHHGIIDELANGNRQTAQRHGVDGKAKVVEHQNRGHERQRNGGQRNQRGAQAEQKEVKDHRHHDTRHHQLALQCADRRLDEAGLPHGDAGLAQASGQAFFHLGQGAFNFFRQCHGVCIGLLLNAQNHRGLAVQPRITALDGGCKLHHCHLHQKYRLLVFESHRQARQVFQPRATASPACAARSEVADQVLARVQFQKTAAGIG